ncbi:conjugative transposon protein TraM [Chryseolinea sp. H1M3-3]|uniref:conjugative transposon protein TraM n=1 Tax=Chryseolinea sp. H1M3-3 TaxID=3034144 RepID=UPI0023EAFE10|nr:conjugative transposon protein TraM [Chryseolinea sp. H1M3-3]
MKRITQKLFQQRKFIMALPVMVMPFLTLLFWALGGGKGTAAHTTKDDQAGLLLELPDAQFKDDAKAWDKLSLYQQAQTDSLKFNEAKRNDPYFRLPPLKANQDTSKKSEAGSINFSLGKKNHALDDNEERINRQIRELQKHISAIPEAASVEGGKENDDSVPAISPLTSDVDRLESMMTMMQSGDQEDEEMKEINDVLTKILDIQHPERVKTRLDESKAANENILSASPAMPEDIVSFLNNRHGILPLDSISREILPPNYSVNGFYGLDELSKEQNEGNAIQAVVYNTQTLIAGSVAKLVLQQDVRINGVIIPANQFVFGTCALNGERLTINVNSIRHGNSIYPVSLSVFDMDGLEGIYVPGAIARDAAKQTSDQTLQGLELTTLDPSLGVQAASAGIEAAKGFLSKKSKMIRVTVKAGHRVLLKDTNTKKN